MKTMKKFLIPVMIAAPMMLNLVACGSGTSTANPSPSPSASASTK